MYATQIRYIVFLLDSSRQHDGYIFASLKEAREYAQDAIKERYCTRFVIGKFINDGKLNHANIHMVETFGFKGDMKHTGQMQLFS
jgi:hypothetical protein